jgi:GNAT superfamily N-acetyltransferase
VKLRDATPADVEATAQLWNQALGEQFSLRATVLRLTVFEDPNLRSGDALAAVDNDTLVGFAWLKRWREPPFREAIGYVGGIVVDAAHQRQGLGTALLRALEARLLEEGCERIEISGGLLHLLPGVPVEATAAHAFFERHGYAFHPPCFDLWQDLAALEFGQPDPRVHLGLDGNAMLDYLEREFPGGWTLHARWHLANGGSPGDFMVVEVDRRIDGFCQIFRPGTWPPGPSTYFNDGGLGPIGVSRRGRGQGLGKALLEASLRELRTSGVRGCVIDWTTLLDFYGIFGFRPWRTYLRASKSMGG